jgi:hypothetical protein
MKGLTMLKAFLCIIAIGIITLASSEALRVRADEKLSTHDIMEKGHKGDSAPVQTIIAGKADEALLKQFLAYYEFMATDKPKVGDEASWKTKTAALVTATKALIDKKPDAATQFKEAVNCKACHTLHKPKKKQ